METVMNGMVKVARRVTVNPLFCCATIVALALALGSRSTLQTTLDSTLAPPPDETRQLAFVLWPRSTHDDSFWCTENVPEAHTCVSESGQQKNCGANARRDETFLDSSRSSLQRPGIGLARLVRVAFWPFR
jgi:hypothetical protein